MRSETPDPGKQAGTFEQSIAAARQGDGEALGHLLESFRPYLLLVANEGLLPDLQAKVGPSDVVQDTFMEAQRDFGGFRGQSEAELVGWLHRILLHNLLSVSRHYRDTEKRGLGRELKQSDAADDLLGAAASDSKSPSKQAMAREREAAVRVALEQLPEHYRQVIEWRNYQRLGFEEIGLKLDRSPAAARKLWVRALEQLEAILGPGHETT